MSRQNEQSRHTEDAYTEHSYEHHHSADGTSSHEHHHSADGTSSHEHHHSSDSSSSHTHHHSSGSGSHHSSGSSSHRSSSGSSSSGHHSSHSGYSRGDADSRRRDALVMKYQVVSNEDEFAAPKEHAKRHRHRMRRSKKIAIILACIPLVLIIALSTTFAVLNMIGKKQVAAEDSGIRANKFSVTYDEGKTVVYNGKTYALNENIVSIAAMGVDREEFGLNNDKIGTAGQADVILIGALDLSNGHVSVLMIPRDSMTDVDQYTVDGQYVGVERMQICLSYAYGNGRDTSCENVLKSVGRVLYDIPIQLYGAMDLAGIPYLNDAVGGVMVTPPETIGKFVAGQPITLVGDEAEQYVRSRNTAILDSDSARRVRQIQYLQSFIKKAVQAAIEDFRIVPDLYNTVSEYAFTNVSLSKVTYLATTLLTKGIQVGDIQTLGGELVDADPYPEFNLNEQAAFETVLNIFYTPVET